MALPPGMMSMRVMGQYLRPNGVPHQGFVTMTPEVTSVSAIPIVGTPFTIALQAARLEIDTNGFVCSDLLNPNDPHIKPGPATGQKWSYYVREHFRRGDTIGWRFEVPDNVPDGGFVDLAMQERHDEMVIRPADWFPRHIQDAQVQAGWISPRNGPLMREVY